MPSWASLARAAAPAGSRAVGARRPDDDAQLEQMDTIRRLCERGQQVRLAQLQLECDTRARGADNECRRLE